MHDVADLAGVSPMTVSRVVNRHPSVTPERRDSVMAAIRKLQYSPSRAARSLARGKAHRIAVPYDNPSNGYMSEFLLGALKESARAGTQLIVEDFTQGESVEDILQRLRRGGSEGVVLPPPLSEWQELIEALSSAGYPAVAVARGHRTMHLPSIRIDNELAAKELTQHLLDQGHRDFGFITGHPNQTASAQRFAGFVSALQGAGIPRDAVQVEQGYFTYRSGIQAAARLLMGADRPTAIFAANDDMAAAASMVAHRLRLNVPKDISIAGFDDTALATTIWPALTTVHQPIAEMAGAAVERLAQMFRSERSNLTAPFDKVVSHRVCVRESTGPNFERQKRRLFDARQARLPTAPPVKRVVSQVE